MNFDVRTLCQNVNKSAHLAILQWTDTHQKLVEVFCNLLQAISSIMGIRGISMRVNMQAISLS